MLFDSTLEQARLGDAKAQYLLARIFGAGKIVAADANQARHYCMLAAEQGHAAAQYAYGVLMEQEESHAEARNSPWASGMPPGGTMRVISKRRCTGLLWLNGKAAKKLPRYFTNCATRRRKNSPFHLRLKKISSFSKKQSTS